MATTLDLKRITITVHAFGETRQVEAIELTWTDPDRPAYNDTRIDTASVFAGRLPSGKKLWKVYAHVKPMAGEPLTYRLSSNSASILNRHGYIVGWWNADRHEPYKSRHNSARK